MREIELTEEEKKTLEALFLRAELIARDLQTLNTLLQSSNSQIQSALAEIAKRNGLDPAGLKPEFRGYQFVRLVYEEESLSRQG